MRLFLVITVWLLACAFTPAKGQIKYEKEYRIRTTAVPKPALDFVRELPFDRRIKWYQEEGFSATSIEAKSCYKKQKYSIEFDQHGHLQDVEIQIRAKSVPGPVLSKIRTNLDIRFKRHRLIKIQKQWSGPSAAVMTSVQAQEMGEQVVEKYEIVIKGKSNEGVYWYEYTFDATGEEEASKKIVLRNTDNLAY